MRYVIALAMESRCTADFPSAERRVPSAGDGRPLAPAPSPFNYTARMPPAFFESMVELITRTSTDLPPDVRAAMRAAMATEDATSRAGQALTIIAQNIDQ